MIGPVTVFSTADNSELRPIFLVTSDATVSAGENPFVVGEKEIFFAVVYRPSMVGPVPGGKS